MNNFWIPVFNISRYLNHQQKKRIEATKPNYKSTKPIGSKIDYRHKRNIRLNWVKNLNFKFSASWHQMILYNQNMKYIDIVNLYRPRINAILFMILWFKLIRLTSHMKGLIISIRKLIFIIFYNLQWSFRKCFNLMIVISLTLLMTHGTITIQK